MKVATAESWYRTARVDDAITHIWEPHIKEFYRCNIWHVRGRERDMLVDSGMGVVGLRDAVSRLAERPVLAVASHTHFDHIGAHHEFDDRAVHGEEAAILANPSRPATLADPYVTDDIFTALPPGEYRSADYDVPAAPATRLLADGDIIDLGDRHYTVLHMPGHSPGSIALWDSADQVLFAGDTVYDGPLITDCYHSDIDDYLASMERLLALPARVVHGGHFPSFDGRRLRVLIRRFLDAAGAGHY
jgi:glyoxylase-like metal-dependent hydrolase (beta-lactamase superfamily II)